MNGPRILNLPTEPVIYTGRLLLKPISVEDTSLIIKWRNDSFVRERFVYRKTFTVEGQLAWLRDHVAEGGDCIQFIAYASREISPARQTACTYEAYVCAESQSMDEENAYFYPIGCSYLRDVDRAKKSAEYGIFIGEENARGKGYGTKILKAMILFSFGEAGLNELLARVYKENEPSIRHFLKEGFKIIREEDVTATDGTVATMCFMALKKDNFKKVNDENSKMCKTKVRKQP